MTNTNMHLPSSPIEEALWAAYRRDDKAAVMDYLFRRSLVGIRCSGSFSRLMIKSRSKINLAARRANSGAVLINGGLSRIPLRSTVN